MVCDAWGGYNGWRGSPALIVVTPSRAPVLDTPPETQVLGGESEGVLPVINSIELFLTVDTRGIAGLVLAIYPAGRRQAARSREGG